MYLHCEKKILYLFYNLKAIHNKDYSVVKTFKPGQLGFLFINSLVVQFFSRLLFLILFLFISFSFIYPFYYIDLNVDFRNLSMVFSFYIYKYEK
jgi:hypothetical protein